MHISSSAQARVLEEDKPPQIRLETDTRIDPDGETRILSNLEIRRTEDSKGAGSVGSPGSMVPPRTMAPPGVTNPPSPTPSPYPPVNGSEGQLIIDHSRS